MKLISMRKKLIKEKTTRRYENAQKDQIYLTTADGDFKIAPNITKSVSKVVKSGNVAYTYQQKAMTKALQIWYKEKFDVTFEHEQVIYGSGVLYWIHIAIRAFSKKNDYILILTPIYLPFGRTIKRMERKVLTSNLIYQNHHWQIDFSDLKLKMQKAKVLAFCSPQNPTGTIWTKEDLIKINTLAKKYKVILLFDEIWQDIILKPPFIHSLSLKDQSQIIHASGPGKGFNLGALQYGHMICKNDVNYQKMLKAHLASITYTSSQPWVSAAVISAYSQLKSVKWQSIYVAKIKENANLMMKFLQKTKLEYAYPEGTFLFFIKFGTKNCHSEKMVKQFANLGVHLISGLQFGKEYKDWIRINLAIETNSIKKLIVIFEQFYEQYWAKKLILS